MKKSGKIIAGVLAALLVCGGGAAFYAKTEGAAASFGERAGELATETLGTEVKIGAVKVNSLSSVSIDSIEVKDKEGGELIKADEAEVSLSLLAAFGSPLDAVKCVTVRGADLTLVERADGSYNIEDLTSSESSSSSFKGRVVVEDASASITSSAIAKDLFLENVNADVDLSNGTAIKATALVEGAEVDVSGLVSGSKNIISVATDEVDLSRLLPYIPAGTIPDEVTPLGGFARDVQATAIYEGTLQSLTGSARLEDASADIMGTRVENVDASASFTDKEVLLDLTAEAAGEAASAHGKIRFDAGVPYLDLVAASDSFAPEKILTDIPYAGAVSFEANITGRATDPIVEAKAKVASGSAYGVAFSDASATVRYEENRVYVQDLAADVLGGRVTGEGELAADTLAYTGHLVGEGVDLTQAAAIEGAEALAAVTGLASFDVGVSGTGADVNTIQAYGSAELDSGSFEGLPISRAGASFAYGAGALDVDFLSVHLPGNGDIGIEGKISNLMADDPYLNLAFYGGHVDLSLLKQFFSDADVTGIADFKGVVTGAVSDPQADVDFSSMHGELFKQPYDSLRFGAAGSLAGLTIEDFSLLKDGKQTWYVDGTIGFVGERKIDLRADTVGVRAEDLMDLISPGFELTGNVDNTIRFTGTLDNPQAVGYVHFYQGSYMGALISGMDGDYFLEDGAVRLQDFHIYSPMIDMDVNGRVTKEGSLDLLAEVHDIDMKRLEHKLPYEVSGHGTFSGKVFGTIDRPLFSGQLDAPSLTMNGVNITNLTGLVDYKDSVVYCSRFSFLQGEGSCDLEASYNVDTGALTGNAIVGSFDIESLCTLLDQKNDKLKGTLSMGAILGGTIDNPTLEFGGDLLNGTAAGYDVHAVAFEGALENHVLNIKNLSGKQGELGSFSFAGTADLGPEKKLDANLSASSLSLGMFAALAGVSADVTGTGDIEASFGGYLTSPEADVKLTAHDGGVKGSTFDTLKGEMHLSAGLLTLNELTLQKAVGTETYQASARGLVPFSALTATDLDALNDYEQIRLEVALDNADLSLLPALSGDVDWAMGRLEGKVFVTGTAAHPLFNGNLGLNNGALKLKLMELPVTDMTASVKLDGSKITVDTLSGKLGRGSYLGSGSLELDGLTPANYDFNLKADDLEVKTDFFTGPVNGDVHIGTGEWFGRTLPKVTAATTIKDCTISVPTLPDSDGELPEVMLDVRADLGNNVHFYSSYLYDMYLTGYVQLGGTTIHPKTSGEVNVKQGGKLSYLKTPFKIREANLYFNQVDSFLPSVNFFADTLVGKTRIYLYVKGPLGAMDLKLGSVPEHSQTEILQILTLGRDYESGTDGITASDMLSLGLQMTVLSELENAVRDLFFLDTFTIYRGGAQSDFSSSKHEGTDDEKEDEYSVEMGKYISPKLMVKFTQGIGGTSRQRYGAEYSFSDRFGVTLEREDSDTVIGVTSRIQF